MRNFAVIAFVSATLIVGPALAKPIGTDSTGIGKGSGNMSTGIGKGGPGMVAPPPPPPPPPPPAPPPPSADRVAMPFHGEHGFVCTVAHVKHTSRYFACDGRHGMRVVHVTGHTRFHIGARPTSFARVHRDDRVMVRARLRHRRWTAASVDIRR